MKLLGTELAPSGLIEKHWLHTDGNGKDQITIERVQDVEPILKRNAEAFNSASSTFGRSEMTKVAEIPSVVIEDMLRIHQISFKEFMDQKSDKSIRIWNDLLNGREFTKFRTRPGRVAIRARV